MSATLTQIEILALLNPDWWLTDYINPPTTVEPASETYSQSVPATVIYFQDDANNWHAWQNSGYIDPLNEDAASNGYLSAIMTECAYELSNLHCAGNITNIMPTSYQPMPIYFK